MIETKKTFSELFQSYIKPIKLQPGSLIKGTIIDLHKESVLVDVGLKSEASVPIAQFHNCYGELTVKIGEQVNFILENIEDGSGGTIISREKAKKEESWEALQEANKEGTIVYGKVISKVKGGLTLDIEGIKAFLPGSLVDSRLNKEFLQDIEGKILELKVIKLDYERKNVVVSRKAVLELEQIKVKQALLADVGADNILSGHVKNITDYGAFIDLGNGIDGLLHITDISWRRIKHPKEVLKIGEIVQVKVIKYDEAQNRISLGLKQLTEDPWSSLPERYPVGHLLKGKVSNILDYGCFVEIEDGIEGLVHISEMAWLHKGLIPEKLVTIGQKVKVVILSVDKKKRRISLGMKECLPNPLQEFCKNSNLGEILLGRVKTITDFGLFVELKRSRLDGLIHISDISWYNFPPQKLYKTYKKGENIKAMILQIDINKERIALGIKQILKSPLNYFLMKVKNGDIVIGQVIDSDPSQYKLTLKLTDILNITIDLNKYINNKKRYHFLNDPIKINDKFYVKIMNLDVIEIDILGKIYDKKEIHHNKKKKYKKTIKGNKFISNKAVANHRKPAHILKKHKKTYKSGG